MTNETQEIIKISDLKHPDEVFGIRREHKTYITNKSIATWHEGNQRYYYKPLDKEYEKMMYHKNKHDMKCDICGSIVVSQMYKHVKRRKCLMVKEAIKKAIDNLTIKQAESSINEISGEKDLKH